MKLKINDKTYHRHLSNLIKRGKIQKLNEYRLVKEKEANLKEVLDCIERIKESKTQDVLEEASLDLWRLCDGKRIVHHLSVPAKFEHPRVLANFVHALHVILSYENRRHLKDLDSITRLCKNRTKIMDILENEHDPEVVGEPIYFLAETGEEAVDIIFDLVEKLSEDEYPNHKENIKCGLFSPNFPLYKNHFSKINKRVFDLIENTELQHRGKDLNKAKRSMTSYS